jgi:hypothetical protein
MEGYSSPYPGILKEALKVFKNKLNIDINWVVIEHKVSNGVN